MSLPIDSAPADDLLDAGGRSLAGESHRSSVDPPAQMSEASDAADSLATFFGNVAPQARRFAMSLVRRWNEAEELVQEAFLRLTQREKHQASSCPAARKGFLFTTIRNLAIDGYRQQQRRPRAEINLDHLGAPKTTTGPALEKLEAVVDQTLQQMNRCWSDALQLKLNGGLTYAEIAEVLDASPAQVRGWIYRARQDLAQALNQSGLLGDDHD